jgi:hypothetical protein
MRALAAPLDFDLHPYLVLAPRGEANDAGVESAGEPRDSRLLAFARSDRGGRSAAWMPSLGDQPVRLLSLAWYTPPLRLLPTTPCPNDERTPMTPYLAALDPRIWVVIVAADRVGCRHARDREWTPSRDLVADFGRRVADLVGPNRVRRPGDDRPELAALFDHAAFDAVMTRVISGLWLSRCRPAQAVTAAGAVARTGAA